MLELDSFLRYCIGYGTLQPCLVWRISRPFLYQFAPNSHAVFWWRTATLQQIPVFFRKTLSKCRILSPKNSYLFTSHISQQQHCSSIADTPLNYDAPDYLNVFVAAVLHLLWENRTDNFGQCSVVELLMENESLWSRINRIVIKIY